MSDGTKSGLRDYALARQLAEEAMKRAESDKLAAGADRKKFHMTQGFPFRDSQLGEPLQKYNEPDSQGWHDDRPVPSTQTTAPIVDRVGRLEDQVEKLQMQVANLIEILVG